MENRLYRSLPIGVLGLLMIAMASCGKSQPPDFTDLAVTIQDSVRAHFSADCVFNEDIDVSDESSYDGSYLVSQSFKSNYDGYPNSYMCFFTVSPDTSDTHPWKIDDVKVLGFMTENEWKWIMKDGQMIRDYSDIPKIGSIKYKIERGVSGDYKAIKFVEELSDTIEAADSVITDYDYPNEIVDKNFNSKFRLYPFAPSTTKRASCNAICRILSFVFKDSVHAPNIKYDTFARQINNENTVLYTGEITSYDDNDNPIDLLASIELVYIGDDPKYSNCSNYWRCHFGIIVY